MSAPGGTSSTPLSSRFSCVCGSKECSGVSAVFKVIKDIRGAHVAVPKSSGSREVAQVWKDSLNIAAWDDTNDSEQYVALHHFDPIVLEHNTKVIIPGKLVEFEQTSISNGDDDESHWKKNKDQFTVRVDDQQFIVAPNYNFERVKLEAQAQFRAHRDTQQQKQQQQKQSSSNPQSPQPPTSIPREITTKITSSNVTIEPAVAQEESDQIVHQSSLAAVATVPAATPATSSLAIQQQQQTKRSTFPVLETCFSNVSDDVPRIYKDDSSSCESYEQNDTKNKQSLLKPEEEKAVNVANVEKVKTGSDSIENAAAETEWQMPRTTGNLLLAQPQKPSNSLDNTENGAVSDQQQEGNDQNGDRMFTPPPSNHDNISDWIKQQELALVSMGIAKTNDNGELDDNITIESLPDDQIPKAFQHQSNSSMSSFSSVSEDGLLHDMAIQATQKTALERKDASELAEKCDGLEIGAQPSETAQSTPSDVNQTSQQQQQQREQELLLGETAVMKEFLGNANGEQATLTTGSTVESDSVLSQSPPPGIQQSQMYSDSGLPYQGSEDDLDDMFRGPAGLDGDDDDLDDTYRGPVDLDDSIDGSNSSGTSAKIEAPGGKVMSLEAFFNLDADIAMDAMFVGPIDLDGLTEAWMSSRTSFRGFRKYKIDADMNIVAEEPKEEVLTQLQELHPLTLLNDERSRDLPETMAIMTAIESKRRCWAMAEINTMTMEWSWYRVIIQRMLKQTDQIEDLLECSFNALAVYSLMMKDIFNDAFLDDKGNMISGASNRTKIENTRKSKAKESTMLDPVLRALREISDRIGEENTLLDSDVYAMSDLKAELLKKAHLMLQEGNDIIAAVEVMESKIQEAWDRFEGAEMGGMSKNSSDKPVGDRWLAEASYKNTVTCCMTTWKGQYKLMTNLYDAITEMDAQRRTRTKEVLLSFIPRRRKVFARAIEIMEPTKSKLQEGRQAHDVHELDVDMAIKHLSRVNLSMKPNRSSIMNRSRTFESDISAPIDLKSLISRNLFESHHVKALQAIEFQSENKSIYEVGLAVITTDDFLHVVGRDADSEVILKAESFYGDTRQAEIQLKEKLNGSIPRLSVFLPECRSSIAHDYSCIEFVTERNPLYQAFKGKASIRLFSPRETYQWWKTQLEPWVQLQEKAAASQGSFRALNTSFRR